MTENRSNGIFEGKSSNGDIYEALENAIESAKGDLGTDFIEWTLGSVSGRYGGFVGVKELTVSIEANSHQPLPLGVRPTETSEENAVQVSEDDPFQIPIFLSGLVSRITGPDFCMDGSTHKLETSTGSERLKAGNDEVKKVLDELSGKRSRATIAGYRIAGAECNHIRVYYAERTGNVVYTLTGGDFPRGIQSVLGSEAPRGVEGGELPRGI